LLRGGKAPLRCSAKLSPLRNSGAEKSAARQISAAPIGEFHYCRHRPCSLSAADFRATPARGEADEEYSACHLVRFAHFRLIRLDARSVALYGPAFALSAV
jgi:hypothetical protein